MDHLRNFVTKQMLFWLLLLALGGGQAVIFPAPVLAAEPTTNRAGLVVVKMDGSVVSRCVGFEEESIDGYELLVRGDFALRADVTSVGTSICSVDGEGCGQGADCFCQCKSSTCEYWTYWQWLPDGWRYSNAGATTMRVSDGDVQGWVWGDTRPDILAENAPPVTTFAEICRADAVVYGIEEAISTPTSSLDEATLDEATVNEATSAEPVGEVSQIGVGISQLWLMALVVLIPLLFGGVLLVRRQRK